jgi:hypothetical protein
MPNSKCQISSNAEKANDPNRKPKSANDSLTFLFDPLGFGIWGLLGIWCLGFGGSWISHQRLVGNPG